MRYLPNSDPERLSKIKKKYPMAYEPWTNHEEECLIQLWKKNKTIENISVKLGRQFGSITSRLLKLGIDIYAVNTETYNAGDKYCSNK